MKKIALIGNSKSAELLLEYIRNDKRYSIQAFSVEDQFIESDNFYNYPLIGLDKLENQYPSTSCSVIMAIGYGDLNRSREKEFNRLKTMGYEIETYIHPDARVYSDNIGEGSIVMPNAFIDVYTEIGPNTVIWGNSTVAHHARVEANCWLASGSVVSGSAVVGNNSFIGISATVVNDVKIGKYNIVGAGALIVKNTGDYEVFISRQTEKFRFSAEDYLRFSKI